MTQSPELSPLQHCQESRFTRHDRLREKIPYPTTVELNANPLRLNWKFLNRIIRAKDIQRLSSYFAVHLKLARILKRFKLSVKFLISLLNRGNTIEAEQKGARLVRRQY